MTTVVKAVQELCRHEDFFLAHILCRLAPRAIVLGFEAIAISPRIEYHTLLRVELREYRLQFIIKSIEYNQLWILFCYFNCACNPARVAIHYFS